MINTKRKKKLETTVEEIRKFSFSYLEKYSPSKQQLRTYLYKRFSNSSNYYVKRNELLSLIDIVISDMAANTTGNKEIDSIRTGNLCLNALELSCKILNNNGVFISKIFMGSVFKEIMDEVKKMFKEVSIFKPKSSRKESKEIYMHCKYLRILND